MSTENLTTTLGRNLLTASALGLLMATPALAQNQAQTNQERARNIEGAYETIAPGNATRNQNSANQSAPGEQDQQQAIIQRSFEEDVDLGEVSNVEAGTTAGTFQRGSQNVSSTDTTNEGQQGLQRSTEQQGLDSSLRNIPDGTAVIAVDGRVIARTTDEDSRNDSAEDNVAASAGDSATNRPQNADSPELREQTPAMTAAERSGHNRTTNSEQQAATANGPVSNGQAGRDEQNAATTGADDLTTIFAVLQDATVVNSEGEDIGSVEDVVLDNQSGDAGLVVSVSESSAKLLAPVSELRVSNNNVVWETSQSLTELQDSAAYNAADRDEISAGDQLPREQGNEGLTQR